MRTQTASQPGQHGAKKFADQLIVEEWPWTPERKSDSSILVKVTFAEKALRQQMRKRSRWRSRNGLSPTSGLGTGRPSTYRWASERVAIYLYRMGSIYL